MKANLGATEPSNFEYVTSRVRVRKAKLFNDDDYRKLVRMSPSEIARFMEESEYQDEINRLGARHTGVDLIEYALYDNMARNFHDIVNWSQGELYMLVVEYLRKYDAWNIKTVLRGIYTEATPEEIKADLIPAGELDEFYLEQLADKDSIEAVIDALEGTEFADSMREGFREYSETNLLVPLENAADKTFYRGLIPEGNEGAEEGTRKIYLDYLRAEIDLLNIRNALRASGSPGITPDDYFIEGGGVFRKTDIAQLSESREDIINALRESEYGEQVEEAITELEETGSLVEFDRTLEKLLMEFSDAMTNKYPLSVAPVISYILAKEREVKNIRGIARGKEAGLDIEEIEQEVVI